LVVVLSISDLHSREGTPALAAGIYNKSSLSFPPFLFFSTSPAAAAAVAAVAATATTTTSM
jgi:hypothetical protein